MRKRLLPRNCHTVLGALLIDVIYPVAGVTKLKAVIAQHRVGGTMDRRIQTVMRGSYASHYRRILPKLLLVLRLRSIGIGGT